MITIRPSLHLIDKPRDFMKISKKMIHALRNASEIRKEALEEKKKIEVDLSHKRKTASELRKLEVKRTVLQKAKEEAEVLEHEMKKLKQFCG
uniref:Uncharacterized protein n=1 Tax=Timema poppense TaxID=170557 RepID=A0A7R9D2X0_TIMPO|nr:unnamed protein product [Timema poppensis]